jgi:hypothetical protein
LSVEPVNLKVTRVPGFRYSIKFSSVEDRKNSTNVLAEGESKRLYLPGG